MRAVTQPEALRIALQTSGSLPLPAFQPCLMPSCPFSHPTRDIPKLRSGSQARAPAAGLTAPSLQTCSPFLILPLLLTMGLHCKFQTITSPGNTSLPFSVPWWQSVSCPFLWKSTTQNCDFLFSFCLSLLLTWIWGGGKKKERIDFWISCSCPCLVHNWFSISVFWMNYCISESIDNQDK